MLSAISLALTNSAPRSIYFLISGVFPGSIVGSLFPNVTNTVALVITGISFLLWGMKDPLITKLAMFFARGEKTIGISDLWPPLTCTLFVLSVRLFFYLALYMDGDAKEEGEKKKFSDMEEAPMKSIQ